MIHVHVRDAAGGHLLDADAYLAATAAIRTAVGDCLVVQITSESLGLYGPAEQMAVIRAVRPEAVSLAIREFAPDAAAEVEFSNFLGWMRRERVTPQIILYSPEDVRRLGDMRARGLVPFDDPPVLYVLGRYTVGQVSSPVDLVPFLGLAVPAFKDWMMCAFGPEEARCATAAALLGGNVRVGFENNLYLPDGSIAPDNAAIVAATAGMIEATGLALADADVLRMRWGAA